MQKVILPSLAIALLDQLTKWFAVHAWEVPWQPLRFLEFRIEYNPGIAWSILLPVPFTILLTIIVLIAGCFFAWRLLDFQKPLTVWTISLILGGAVGNLIDRLARGAVIDFIHLRNMTIFNLADAAITIGAILLLLFFTRCHKEQLRAQ